MNSCPWGLNKANLAKFHEEEWGRPVHEDNKLFEFLSLSVLAAGLSYETILDKRDDLCLAFHDFEIDKVAQMSPEEIERILYDKKMIRNKKKVSAVVCNATVSQKMRANGQTLDDFFWSYTGFRTIDNKWLHAEMIPEQTLLSRKISDEMHERGFIMVGPVLIYSFLETVGIVNDHLIDCQARIS